MNNPQVIFSNEMISFNYSFPAEFEDNKPFYDNSRELFLSLNGKDLTCSGKNLHFVINLPSLKFVVFFKFNKNNSIF